MFAPKFHLCWFLASTTHICKDILTLFKVLYEIKNILHRLVRSFDSKR
jgi:hypothetical protein